MACIRAGISLCCFLSNESKLVEIYGAPFARIRRRERPITAHISADRCYYNQLFTCDDAASSSGTALALVALPFVFSEVCSESSVVYCCVGRSCTRAGMRNIIRSFADGSSRRDGNNQ